MLPPRRNVRGITATAGGTAAAITKPLRIISSSMMSHESPMKVPPSTTKLSINAARMGTRIPLQSRNILAEMSMMETVMITPRTGSRACSVHEAPPLNAIATAMPSRNTKLVFPKRPDKRALIDINARRPMVRDSKTSASLRDSHAADRYKRVLLRQCRRISTRCQCQRCRVKPRAKRFRGRGDPGPSAGGEGAPLHCREDSHSQHCLT